MARKISMAAIEAALRSPKTPAGLKKGLMKKYGHLLGGSKVPMEALATTMRPNHPKGPKYLIVGRYRHQPQSPWVQYDGYDERQMATDELRSWRNEKPDNIFKVVLAKSFYPYSNPTKKMRPNPKKLSPHLALEKQDTIAKGMKKPVYEVYEVPQVGDVIKVKNKKFLIRRHVGHKYHIEDTRGFTHIVREADLADARPQIIDHQRS